MRLCLSILLPLISFACFAQIQSENVAIYTRKDGLSNNSINCMLKDNRGFLWIGTSEGLNRFDGKHFLSFFNEPATYASLSGNNIFDMLQYNPGQFLIATNNGLSVFNTITNTFENQKIQIAALQKGSGNYIRSLFKDEQTQRIYINHSGEIDVFNDSLRFLYRLSNLTWAKSLKGLSIEAKGWIKDNQNRIWIPELHGIIILDEKNHHVYSQQNNPLHYPFIVSNAIRSFFYDQKNQIVWYSSWGLGLKKYDLKNQTLQTQYFGLANANEARTINAITENNGSLICYGAQNIYKVDTQTMKFEFLNKHFDFNFPDGFINTHVVLKDSDNIWIGTETKGIIQLPASVSSVEQLSLPYRIQDYTNFSTGILRSENGLLYMAYGFDGLLEVNEQTKKINRFKISDVAAKPQTVYRICEDGKKRMWVGTSSGVYEFDKKTKKFKRPDFLPAFTNHLSVSYLFCDSKGNIWMSFAEPNSLGYYDILSNQFFYFKNYKIDGKVVFNNQYSITRMAEEKNGNIWMISYQHGGLLCFEASTKQWKLFPRSSKASALAQKELNSICLIGHTLWLSNIYGFGLVKYNYANDSMQSFSRKDGLLSENVLAITKEKNGKLLLTTTSGINYLNPANNELHALSFNDQNIDWGFAFTQFYDSVKNELVYGLNDRIVIIKNKLWETQSVRLATYIDKIKINNTVYAPRNDFLLTHLQKNISIDFTSINYNKNASLVYAYKMEGIDKDWNIMPQATAANYSNLPPGQYTFLVKAKYQSGDWGPVNNSLHITIVAALWQRVWFWLLASMLIALGIFFLMKKRINAIRKNAQLKQKLTETEMMALRSQMNPHFIFNCLNAIDNLIQTNQPDKATTYLARFAKLIRSLLESSKNNLVPFHKDFETLQLYLQLEQFRTNNKFAYELKADEELLHGDYKIPPLIVQPFVENAIHHGLLNKQSSEKKLSVKASIENNFIKYNIADNGVGRAKAQEIKDLNKPEHQSYGIQITSERIHLHNKNGKSTDIVIKDIINNGLMEGTEVEIKIKID